MTRVLLTASFSAALLVAATVIPVATSQAATFDLPITFPQAGDVTLTLEHSSGGFDHLLYLHPSLTPIMALTDPGDPSANVLGVTPATVGDTISLGSFNAHEELVFLLVNVESHRLGTPGTLAGEIYSGSSSVLNPGPYFTLIDDSDPLTRVVHFEDLFPTSDQTAFLDGHDVRFTLTLTPVPLPAAAWFFGSGVIGLAGLARRRMMWE